MTQKSYGRKVRDMQKKELDAHLKENKTYDELNTTFYRCKELLLSHTYILAVIKDPDLIACIQNKTVFIDNVRSLARDLKAMDDELLQIHNQHEGKTGGTSDPDELLRCLNINEQYFLFMERHDHVVQPTAIELAEQLDVAKKILEERQKKAKDALQQTGDGQPIEGKVVEKVVPYTDEAIATAKVEELAATPVAPADFDKLRESYNDLHQQQEQTPIPEGDTNGK